MPKNSPTTRPARKTARPIKAAEIFDWKEVLAKVKNRREEYIIEEDGQPVAAFVPFTTYQEWQKVGKGASEEFLEIVDKIQCRAQAKGARKIRALINEAVREVRK